MKRLLHMVALCGLLGMSACEIPFEIEQKGTSLIYFQAIANQDTFVVYHRLYDLVSISVISDKNTVGFFDMNTKITVETE